MSKHPIDWSAPMTDRDIVTLRIAGEFAKECPGPRMTVYFVQVGTDGPIKIGKTRGNPAVRLMDLQSGNPYLLRIRAVIVEADAGMEFRLHEEFHDIRLHGEWFRPEPQLIGHIEDYARPWEDVAHRWPAPIPNVGKGRRKGRKRA